MRSDPGPALAEDIKSFPLSLANYSYTGHNHQPVQTLTRSHVMAYHRTHQPMAHQNWSQYILLLWKKSSYVSFVKRDIMCRWHEHVRSVKPTLTMHAWTRNDDVWLWQSQCLDIPPSLHVFLNDNYPALVSAPLVSPLWQLLWSFTEPVLLLLLRCALDGRECGCVRDASYVVLLTRDCQ